MRSGDLCPSSSWGCEQERNTGGSQTAAEEPCCWGRLWEGCVNVLPASATLVWRAWSGPEGLSW